MQCSFNRPYQYGREFERDVVASNIIRSGDEQNRRGKPYRGFGSCCVEAGLRALRLVVSAAQAFVDRRGLRRMYGDHPHLAFRAQRPRRAEQVHGESTIGLGHVIGVAHDDMSLSLYEGLYGLKRTWVHKVGAAKSHRILAGRIWDRKCELER